jgi:integrase
MPYKEDKNWRATPFYKGKRLKTAVFATKKEALEYEAKAKKKAKDREKRKQQGMDLMSFCIKYLDYATRHAPKVYQEKKLVTKRILTEWGADTLVSEITPEDAQRYLDAQAKERSANAANKDRKNLMAMWNKGIKFFGIKDNPFTTSERRSHDRQVQYTPPSSDVLKVLMAATRKERVFLDAYLQTGARRSEIFRWTWVDDINFERREYRLGTRKTADGSMHYEWFPMSEDLYASLQWKWENRTIKKSPYVFIDDQKGPHYGKPYTERRRFMAGLCKRAKVRPFGFHALRRFVASILADSGKSTNAIRRVLRHKNVSTTERYIQNVNNDLKETMGALSFEKLFSGGHEDDPQKKIST